MLKKHVQFPEDFKCVEEEEVLCTNDSNGNGSNGSGPLVNWTRAYLIWKFGAISRNKKIRIHWIEL